MENLPLSNGNSPVIHTGLYFLKRDDLHKTEKPYAFKFPMKDGFRQSNMQHERIEGIPVTDMRGFERSFTIESNGFTVFKVDSGLNYEDFPGASKVSPYFRKMETLLKSHLGASRVEVFRHCIRKRHPAYPVSTGETYVYDQPTTVVHIDTTPEGTNEEVRRQIGEEADFLLNKRHQWINFWKPLRGPANDWPLLLCDASTVDRKRDLTGSDLLYPDLATENSQVYYKPGFKWYYLSSHQTNEVIVFKQSDSLESACPGVPHCAFFNPLAPADEAPRESIEGRALVYYD